MSRGGLESDITSRLKEMLRELKSSNERCLWMWATASPFGMSEAKDLSLYLADLESFCLNVRTSAPESLRVSWTARF